MYLRFDLLLVVATLCLGTTRATYGDDLEDDIYSRVARHTQVLVDPNLQRHRPVLLPGHQRPLVQIPENYPQEKLRVQHSVMEEVAEDDLAPRVPRSLRQSSIPRPGPTRPQPSPTFPRPPRPTRFRREDEVDDEPTARYARSLHSYQPRYPYPVPQPSPTFPRPEDTHGPVLARFRRDGGSVSVDVEKSRGSKPTARVTAEQNVYRSGDGRTRVDASAYATNRGDRGGMINFSHRF